MNPALLFLLLMIPGTFLLGLNDTLVRRILKNNKVDQQLLLGFDFIGSAIVLASLLLIFGIPEIKHGFWSAFLISTTMNIFAQWAWYTAFRREEASLVAPLRILSPPIVILTGYLVLSEVPSGAGVLGIFITLVGLWFLMKSEAQFEQIQFSDLLKRPGVLVGLWGAFSFAVSFPFDKKAVVASSALFFGVLGLFAVGLANLVIGFILRRRDGGFFYGIKEHWRFMIWIPFTHSLGTFLSFASLNYALAAYAASVKRLWSFWTVILSGRFLEEKNVKKKLLATVIMLGGIAVTVFLG